MTVRIPQALCGACMVEMGIKQTGIVTEMVTSDGTPYYKVSGDLYECPDCGAVVTLLARREMAEAYQPAYPKIRAGQTGRFND